MCYPVLENRDILGIILPYVPKEDRKNLSFCSKRILELINPDLFGRFKLANSEIPFKVEALRCFRILRDVDANVFYTHCYVKHAVGSHSINEQMPWSLRIALFKELSDDDIVEQINKFHIGNYASDIQGRYYKAAYRILQDLKRRNLSALLKAPMEVLQSVLVDVVWIQTLKVREVNLLRLHFLRMDIDCGGLKYLKKLQKKNWKKINSPKYLINILQREIKLNNPDLKTVEKILKLIFENNVDLKKFPVIHGALVHCEALKLIRLLIENGATVETKNKDGFTPIQYFFNIFDFLDNISIDKSVPRFLLQNGDDNILNLSIFKSILEDESTQKISDQYSTFKGLNRDNIREIFDRKLSSKKIFPSPIDFIKIAVKSYFDPHVFISNGLFYYPWGDEGEQLIEIFDLLKKWGADFTCYIDNMTYKMLRSPCWENVPLCQKVIEYLAKDQDLVTVFAKLVGRITEISSLEHKIESFQDWNPIIKKWFYSDGTKHKKRLFSEISKEDAIWVACSLNEAVKVNRLLNTWKESGECSAEWGKALGLCSKADLRNHITDVLFNDVCPYSSSPEFLPGLLYLYDNRNLELKELMYYILKMPRDHNLLEGILESKHCLEILLPLYEYRSEWFEDCSFFLKMYRNSIHSTIHAYVKDIKVCEKLLVLCDTKRSEINDLIFCNIIINQPSNASVRYTKGNITIWRHIFSQFMTREALEANDFQNLYLLFWRLRSDGPPEYIWKIIRHLLETMNVNMNPAGKTPLIEEFLSQSFTLQATPTVLKIIEYLWVKSNRIPTLALHDYTSYSSWKMFFEHIIKMGHPIDHKDVLGNTPLHNACKDGNVSVAKLLLSNGANREEKNNEGKTPWDIVKESHDYEMGLLFMLK